MVLPWKVKYWNGSAWTNAEMRRWNGSAWVATNSYYWDGSSWVLQTDRTPPTQTYTITYGPVIWRGSYKGDNSKRTDSNGNSHNYQGDGGSGYGLQRCMWSMGLGPHNDLLGSTTIYFNNALLVNQHTWYNAGGTARVGTHPVNSGSAPSTYSERSVNVASVHFDPGQTKWFGLPTSVAVEFRSGLSFGFTLKAPNSDNEYYGYYYTNMNYQVSFEK